MPVLIPRRASRRGVFKNVSKAWPLPVLKPTARFALWRVQERFKNLAFASAKTYGALRVVLSPLATEAQNLIIFLFFEKYFCVTILLCSY